MNYSYKEKQKLLKEVSVMSKAIIPLAQLEGASSEKMEEMLSILDDISEDLYRLEGLEK